MAASPHDFLGAPSRPQTRGTAAARAETAVSTAPPAPAAAPDSLTEAMTRLAGGERAALRRVYDESSGRLFSLCLRILRDRDAAEEVLQEVYVTVWRRAGQFDASQGGALGWLITIARNRAVDRLRTDRRRPHTSEAALLALADPSPGAHLGLERSQAEALVRARLNDLDPRSAWAIRTAFFEDVSYPELARRAGVPTATIKSRIRRGLLQMKKAWTDDPA